MVKTAGLGAALSSLFSSSSDSRASVAAHASELNSPLSCTRLFLVALLECLTHSS
jgi:hypothetical protein